MRNIMKVTFLKASFCVKTTFCAFTSFTQKSPIEVVSVPRLDSLVRDKSDQDTDLVRGFRIILTTEKTKPEIKKYRRQFILIHPEVATYIVFESPNYILKVGHFQFKEDAYQSKEQLNNLPLRFYKKGISF